MSDAHYQPELWLVEKDAIYAARYALEDGLESAQELLAKHDADLGRSIPKNRREAERLEKVILDTKHAIELMRRQPAERKQFTHGA